MWLPVGLGSHCPGFLKPRADFVIDVCRGAPFQVMGELAWRRLDDLLSADRRLPAPECDRQYQRIVLAAQGFEDVPGFFLSGEEVMQCHEVFQMGDRCSCL